MPCLETDMRQNKTFRLEDRLIKELEALAVRSGTTANSYLETLLFRHLQSMGCIAMDEQPPQPGRGGRREGAGRKPKSKEPPQD